VSFAVRGVFQTHGSNPNKLDVVITVIDSEQTSPLANSMELFRRLTLYSTHLLQDYFTEIRRIHHTHPSSSCALYDCPNIFDRNAHETNVVVRVADILWRTAGLSTILPWSTIHIPTSVYSLPLPLAEEIGGWDGDPTAIGEDMHMSLKAYFNSHGRLATVPIYK
jgi:hypothetical protein